MVPEGKEIVELGVPDYIGPHGPWVRVGFSLSEMKNLCGSLSRKKTILGREQTAVGLGPRGRPIRWQESR